MKKVFLIMFLIFAGCAEKRNEEEILKTSLSLISSCEEFNLIVKEAQEKYKEFTNVYFGDDIVLFMGGDMMTVNEKGGNKFREYSGTNVQEEGVDEADFVKTDGDYIYLLSSTYFVIVKAFPPENFSVSSSTPVEGFPHDMFIYKNRAVVFSSVYMPEILGNSGENYITYYSTLKITVFDISEKTSPKPVNELYIEGGYIDSRMRESTVYIIGTSYIFPREGIEGENLIPHYYLVSHSGNEKTKSTGKIAECADFYRVPEIYDLSVLFILSIDLSKPLTKPSGTAIFGSWGEVYASDKSIYIASPRYYLRFRALSKEIENEEETFIHKFDIGSNPEKAVYKASGKVKGYPLNQFSMDEENDFFRIATSTGFFSQRSNFLFVMREEANLLRVVGKIEDISPEEGIYSVRFIGNKGFIVTFRQIDPLFTLDLSDPYEPKIAGELKIPGASTYIHLLDGNHLLTLGIETEEVDEGWIMRNGIQIQIFDVSDLKNPLLLHKEVIKNAYSEAEFEHRAFTYFRSKGILSIPVSIYPQCFDGTPECLEPFIGFKIYRVSLENGFEHLFDVNHTRAECVNDEYFGRYCYSVNYPERSVIIENYIYTLSHTFMKVNEINSGNFIGEVNLPFNYRVWME